MKIDDKSILKLKRTKQIKGKGAAVEDNLISSSRIDEEPGSEEDHDSRS